MFVREVGTWQQQAKLVGSAIPPGCSFGSSVALEADTVVIGATCVNAATVFVRSGTTWTEQATLRGGDAVAGDAFGSSVAIHADLAVVTAPNDNGTGSATVFGRTGTTWTELLQLAADDGTPGDGFGTAVAIDGSTIVVGAGYDDHAGALSGSAYVFVVAGALDEWVQQAKLVAADPEPGDYFGADVALSGDTIVSSAQLARRGAGFVSVFDRTGTTWTRTAQLEPADAAAYTHFGEAIDIAGDVVAVAGGQTPSGVGAAYVFTRSTGDWEQHAKVSTSTQFGSGVDVDAMSVVVGGGTQLDNLGGAYVFTV